MENRPGSRMNTDRFPKRAPKVQASWGIQGMLPQQIVGFHMTSLKFKLQNYWSFWSFTFMMY